MTTREICEYYGQDYDNVKHMTNFLKRLKKRYKIEKELEWWRTYGEYVSRVHNNVDAEACGYADGDDEYEENFADSQ